MNVQKIAKEILESTKVNGLLVYVPRGITAKEWAEKKHDTYGFDYDTERIRLHTVFVWPLEDVSLDELKKKFWADNITSAQMTRTI
jgi:hypothetical protein